MAKIIDDETMENVCILAKLSLTEDEKEKAKEDMQKMHRNRKKTSIRFRKQLDKTGDRTWIWEN